MQKIAQILKQNNLSESSLDVEVILAHVLEVPRSYLRAYPERELTQQEENQFNTLIHQLHQGMPVAYLTGHKEFWSLDLLVTPDTLIPRPETELVVELVLATKPEKSCVVADLGTGSGAIALALAHERSQWEVYATDESQSALTVAKTNAERLKIPNVTFLLGSWCEPLPAKRFDVIVSNPPYIAEDDVDIQAAVLHYEPRSALIAAENGLDDLQQIIHAARAFLKSDGLLFLEHGFKQGESVRSIFLKAGYNDVQTYCDLAGLERVTIGRWH